MKKFDEYGILLPEILLPKNKDLSRWSVIACDQYTQDFDYWKKVEESSSGSPSTLNLILPEVYLSSPDRKSMIEKIRSNMKNYIENGVFDAPENEFIYVERKTEYGRIRHGLVCAIDLDSYEWKPFSKSLIRATEATIVDRIPPRKEIRKHAPLELPHIMLLVNDPDKTLVEACGEESKKNSPVYDGDLMMNSGHISGWAVKSDSQLDKISCALENLKKSGMDGEGNSFLFAVGDGNHSLATAKAVWDEYREELRASGADESKITSSPVRYALVEIVNIYDSGLTFEPIHRVIFDANKKDLLSFVEKNLDGKLSEVDSADVLEKRVHDSRNSFGFVFVENSKEKFVLLETNVSELAVSRLQPVLDEFLRGSSSEIDYIHGSEEVFRLGKKDNAVSILLPPIAKDSFFDTISGRGPLPRKSFSMGEASEKRFYLECRKLFQD